MDNNGTDNTIEDDIIVNIVFQHHKNNWYYLIYIYSCHVLYYRNLNSFQIALVKTSAIFIYYYITF
jgi:hypothetical protein